MHTLVVAIRAKGKREKRQDCRHQGEQANPIADDCREHGRRSGRGNLAKVAVGVRVARHAESGETSVAAVGSKGNVIE